MTEPNWCDLSRRELQVLRLIADGHSQPDVALLLHISPRTVEAHMNHIFDKVGLRTTVQVAVKAARAGVL